MELRTVALNLCAHLLCSCSALCPWGYGGNGRLGGIPLFFFFTFYLLYFTFNFSVLSERLRDGSWRVKF